MGATLPVLATALLRSETHDANSVTRLYTCNLAGAILGTLAAGFILLPTFGVRTTIIIAAAINVLVGLIALGIQRRVRLQSRLPKETPRLEVTEQPDHSLFWILAALASGFVTISTQVAWTRVLTMIIGSSTYAFSIVVALFLLGLAAGAWLTGRKDRSAKLRPTIVVVELLTALSLLFSLFVLNRIPALLIALGLRFQIHTWLGLLTLQLISATLLIFVPALLMGMVMPLVLVWASNQARAVSRVGRSYAVNTIGRASC